MNAINTYRNASVSTAPRGKLLLMLYDGLIRFMDQAHAALSDGDIELGHRHLMRCQDIVIELRATLDHDKAPEISENLEALYTFVYTKLVDANRLKDASHVESVRPLILELREAFAQAERQFSTEGGTW